MSDMTLSPRELEALAEARHRFWCTSAHHRAPHCRNSVESGVDANAIGNETEAIEAILAARLSQEREQVRAEARLAHLPSIQGHTRSVPECGGPDFCAECSDAVGDWVAWPCNPRRLAEHDCQTCPDCLHDGARCCGCYDGSCCRLVQDGPRPAQEGEQ